jgi:hypothetical protein
VLAPSWPGIGVLGRFAGVAGWRTAGQYRVESRDGMCRSQAVSSPLTRRSVSARAATADQAPRVQAGPARLPKMEDPR